MNNIETNFISKSKNILNIINSIHGFINDMQKDYYKKFNTYMLIEGNYGNYTLNDDNYNRFLNKKISNLLWAMNLLENNPTVCEIGFNTGFSSSIIILGLHNKNPNFYIFDYNEHNYVKPCFDLFKTRFENNINKLEFIEGNSIITVPEFINKNQNLIGTFDFIHIDGGHSEECIKNDFKNCDSLIKIGGIIIIDDTNVKHINDEVDFYIKNNNYIELFFSDVSNFIYPHRIIQKK
jgi:predicted O-methyltransferase YrrM